MDWAVSVIVPFYNAAPWLERCLESLLAQHLCELEIILVDDASTDSSPKIAGRYAVCYPDRIRYLRQESNMGPGAARNAGIALARGEYVGFVDADDMAEPDMFSSLHTAARKTGAQVAVCGMRIVSNGRECDCLPKRIRSARDLLGDSDLLSPPWNKIYLRSFITVNGITFPVSRMSEDMAFAFKAMARAPQLACVIKALYVYIKHESCVTLDMSKRADALISMAELKSYLYRIDKFNDYKNYYRKMQFLHLFYYPICLLFIDGLLKGNNKLHIFRQAPRYFYELVKFLFRRSI